MDALLARRMLRTLEPYHAVVYAVPEAEAAYTALGLRPGRMGYFASRSAAMGPVPAEVVIATFYNFQPDLIRSVIPEAWSLASPAAILEARLRVVDAGLRRILGEKALLSPEMEEAAASARVAAEACTPVGRALYAAHASLPWPKEPHLALWHALTLLREFRGDGHIAALVAAGHSGCDALMMHHAMDELPRAFAASRNWSDAEWTANRASLMDRGLFDSDGALTAAGRESRQWVEDRTDELALPVWEPLGETGCARLRELVRPWSRVISDTALGSLSVLR